MIFASIEAGLQPGSFLALFKKQFGPRSIATRAILHNPLHSSSAHHRSHPLLVLRINARILYHR
jgi:hypothetical protein